MRETQSKILHANTCKVYIYDNAFQKTNTIVGGLQDLVLTFEYDNYYYDYIGGREARVGKPSVKGSFRQGVLDFDLLKSIFFKTLITPYKDFTNIDLNDYLSFHQDKIRLELIGVEELDGDKTTINKIILNGVIFNSISYEIRAGSFVLGNGTFMTDSIKIGSEQVEINILSPILDYMGTI